MNQVSVTQGAKDIPGQTVELEQLTTPCYICDEAVLARHMATVAQVQARCGAKVLLALKAFATFSLFPQMRDTLAGAAASSLNEARLAAEEFGGELHLCAPAYRAEEIGQLFDLSDHVVFNSNSQWRRFRAMAAKRSLACGLRINPQHSEVDHEIYDPCAPGSRLGITSDELEPEELAGISGLHFHSLCGSDADALARTLEVVEAKFGRWLPQMTWINMGGGHHICRADYDLDQLCDLISDFRKRHQVEVYLEPGEGIVMDVGTLVGTVLDLLPNGSVILDVSASAHMPDSLEMPYRVDITGAGQPGDLPYTYRLGGPTCMAGDIIGDYSFAKPLEVGSRLVFEDMAPYTMVKNTFFNGVPLPSIAIREAETGRLRMVRQFTYEDYRTRLS